MSTGIVRAPLHTEVMENLASVNAGVSAPEETAAPGAREFHVTFFDPGCGRIQHEIFATLATAERFADSQCSSEDAWSTVDVVDGPAALNAA
ncbi:hypothetical protein [Pseudarthrobacter sp. PS3-L1]|uniref:hypothetical protein n=1 Tax=Pseudarthrobacter sp. PS3-L1 TaxID=3046207 RepID=UPI0024B9F145|nr:hypothetical protein [Pseudarthrobacter sp. PS3-L1]MDJ0320453.1 hypothetical protein [Pseudarthrobacter sp. PS3-L1]